MGPNQPPPFENVNLLTSDLPLREAVSRAGVDAKDLATFGADYGSAEMMELGRLANENPPRLRVFEPNGERADRVEFHLAWHALMRKSMAAGLHDSTGDIVERAARLYMATQVEAGHICPLTMTSAASAALKAAPEMLAAWRPYTTARDYDGAFRPWFKKKSATLGMRMTERQSGTDVRATITEARPNNGHYEITGHKWFLSVPMSDGFLVLAQAPAGLTCFLLPRFRPDGSVNALRLQRPSRPSVLWVRFSKSRRIRGSRVVTVNDSHFDLSMSLMNAGTPKTLSPGGQPVPERPGAAGFAAVENRGRRHRTQRRGVRHRPIGDDDEIILVKRDLAFFSFSQNFQGRDPISIR